MERKRLERLLAVASYSTVCLKFHYNYSLFSSLIHPNNSFHECVTVIVILLLIIIIIISIGSGTL